MMEWPILSFLIWLPIMGGLGVLIIGDRYGARQAALLLAAITFLLSLPLYFAYDAVAGTMQFTETFKWIDALGVHVNYDLGVDGVSIALILLNTFMTVLVLAASWQAVKERVAQYMAAFLILEGLVNGVFMARDALLFYVFFEGMLIPLFLILGVWGGPQRIHATIKYFIYTFAGSVFLLVSLIYLYTQTSNGSFFLPDLYALTHLSENAQLLVFLSFLVAFGVKVPLWPLHTWLPDAYAQAPTGGSVMLAAISVKVGGYAFYRLAMPIVPEAAHDWALLVVSLSLVAIVYMSLIALVQTNLKKLVAYSSVAHMGFVTLGLFLVFKLQGLAFVDANMTGSVLAVQGAMVQMISHGFVAGALFLAVGMLFERMQTVEISAYQGITSRMPIFATFFMLFAMANVGLPGTSGFVGEFFVILASAKAHFWVAFIAATTLIFGAAYTLWAVKRVLFGEVNSSEVNKLSDLSRREFAILAVLALAILGLGWWPEPLTQLMEGSIRQWMMIVSPSDLMPAVKGSS